MMSNNVTETLNTGSSYCSLSKSVSLFSFYFTKYTVSFAGREGTTGPKGSPGSPGTPGFPGAQVRLLFQINIQIIPQVLFQRNLMAT